MRIGKNQAVRYEGWRDDRVSITVIAGTEPQRNGKHIVLLQQNLAWKNLD